jgi:hydrogenase maturation protease
MTDEPGSFWTEMEKPARESVLVDGVEVRRGSRVRLHPRARGDIIDLALTGRVAVVESLEEDDAGNVHVAVTIEDDPGRDLGMSKFPGHRFFFRSDEIEVVRGRVLVAGIGNVFLGDDGFGSAVVRELRERPLPAGVVVEDFGIRGMALAYALRDYDTVIMVDATRQGGEAGTLYVIDARGDADGPVAVDTHGMDPVRVLAFARALGPLPERVFVVGCEPGVIPDVASDEIVAELSAPVAAAVESAVVQVEQLLSEKIQQEG